MTGVCGLAGGVLCELVENGVNRVSGEENFQNKEEKTRFEKMMPVLKDRKSVV